MLRAKCHATAQNCHRTRSEAQGRVWVRAPCAALCDVICDVTSATSTNLPQLAALTEMGFQCDETRMNIAQDAIPAHYRYPHFQN